MYCDGVFRINYVESCKGAFAKIQSGYEPDKQKVINFLAIIDRVSILGYPNVRFKGELKMTDKENGLNIAKEFIKNLTY